MSVRQITFFALIACAKAHSWVEQLTVIASNGTFVGSPGYPRGNYLRTTSGFSDLTMTNLIPPNTQANITVIYPTTKLCKSTQQTQDQTSGSSRLQASAGAAIALRYQENGHVTLPWNQPGKPNNRGTVYVYGTTEPKTGEKLLDVHGQWNEEGTGGDKRGVLLSKQNFDDGRCYQINSGNISVSRQEKYPHQANLLMGANLWCQQDFQLPSDAPTGKLYTLYWVWDWPTAAGVDPTYPDGKQEVYTTCMDVDVQAASQSQMLVKDQSDGYDTGQDLNEAAIPTEFAQVFSEQAQETETTSSSLFTSSPSPSVIMITVTAPNPTLSTPLPTVTVTSWETLFRTVTV